MAWRMTQEGDVIRGSAPAFFNVPFVVATLRESTEDLHAVETKLAEILERPGRYDDASEAMSRLRINLVRLEQIAEQTARVLER